MISFVLGAAMARTYSSFSVGCQTAIIYAVTKGYLNDIPVNKVSEYETALYEFLKTHYAELLKRFDAGKFDDADVEELKKALTKMNDEFRA